MWAPQTQMSQSLINNDEEQVVSSENEQQQQQQHRRNATPFPATAAVVPPRHHSLTPTPTKSVDNDDDDDEKQQGNHFVIRWQSPSMFGNMIQSIFNKSELRYEFYVFLAHKTLKWRAELDPNNSRSIRFQMYNNAHVFSTTATAPMTITIIMLPYAIERPLESPTQHEHNDYRIYFAYIKKLSTIPAVNDF